MINKWDNSIMTSIVLRIRIFCVQNNQEIEAMLIIDSNDKIYIQGIDAHTLCDQLGTINIGVEIEILYILYEDNNSWSKYPYSWFSDIFDSETFIYYDEYKRCFDSRCFKVGDKHYYLSKRNQIGESMKFAEFIAYFCKEIKTLSYDIILLRDNQTSYPLIGEFQKELDLALKERKMHEIRIALRERRSNMKRQSTQIKYKSRQNEQIYSYQNKIRKNYKTYWNNKR